MPLPQFEAFLEEELKQTANRGKSSSGQAGDARYSQRGVALKRRWLTAKLFSVRGRISHSTFAAIDQELFRFAAKYGRSSKQTSRAE